MKIRIYDIENLPFGCQITVKTFNGSLETSTASLEDFELAAIVPHIIKTSNRKITPPTMEISNTLFSNNFLKSIYPSLFYIIHILGNYENTKSAIA